MNDPYSVLGVTKDATEEQIKDAYRELARKYHPDNYADNPLKDLAAEKMKEVNEAYDKIISSRKSAPGRTSSNSDGGFTEFPQIAQLIQSGQYEQAQLLLDQVPIDRRTACWYYLSGNVLYSRGWYDDAYSNYATACRMDPSKQEYRSALEHMNRRHNGGGYRRRNVNIPSRGGSCSSCDICSTLICADCCCECMGGDLISCC